MSHPPAFEFRHVGKTFFETRALSDVSFPVGAGQVLGLVGENGAGKSTLMNVLGGILQPDTGEMWLAGSRYLPQTPLEAAGQGIAVVHQELNLFPNLSVAENLFLTELPCRRRFGIRRIDRRELRRRAVEVLYAVGNDPAAARKAGVGVERIQVAVYMICATTAAVSGMIALAQLAAVSPNMGQGRELEVIAAAVLGGASLFGGRGTAVGAVLGALLIETVRNGLNLVDADPYIYPMISGAIIFLAVLLDSVSHQQMARLTRRKIRPLTDGASGERRSPYAG